MEQINQKYKDSLFRLLFGREDMKDNILSLYNALNNTSYSNPDDLEIRTLSEAVYIKMKNDVAFLIDSFLPLWEQQSTFNPNMPLRGLMYFSDLYNAYITEKELNIYGTKLVNIPTPQYVVFYNGDANKPPIMKLKLSDAFMNKNEDDDFEWTATMYNLNKGQNDELLLKCKPLSDYMTLVNYINYYKKEHTVEEAVNMTVTRCIKENILKDILLKNKAEVMNMVITEFNEEVFVKGIREEGREEGLEEGLEKGLEKGLEEGRKEREALEAEVQILKKEIEELKLSIKQS